MGFTSFSINGRLQEGSAENRLAAYSVGAFESFRVHDGKVFLLDEHFGRLSKSLEALDITWDDDRQKYYSWIADICRNLPEDKDAFIRFTVAKTGRATEVLIQVKPLTFFSPKSFQAVIINGLKLEKPDYFTDIGFRIKSIDYLKQRLDTKKSVNLPEGIEGILLTPAGYVAEAQTANVFWVSNDKLFTPPLETSILAGTMRDYLLKNNQVEELLAEPEELETADEIILTSGASYLRPLSKINDKQKPGTNGTTFKNLYERLVADIEKNSYKL